MIKKLSIVVGVLVGLLVVAAVAVSFVDVNYFKPQIANFVATRYNRTLSFEGDLKLSIFPHVGVTLPEVRLSEPNQPEQEAARLTSAQVSVALLPLLALLFSAVGIVGAWVVGVQMIGVDPGSFWSQMQGGVSFRADVLNGVIKSFVFALLCGFIALVVGHESDATPEGVARATTTTVVISSLAVLASDVLMTALMFGGL